MAGKYESYANEVFIVKGLAKGDIEWLTELSGLSRQSVVNILKGEYNTKRVHEYVLYLARELGQLRIKYADKLKADFVSVLEEAETIKQPVVVH